MRLDFDDVLIFAVFLALAFGPLVLAVLAAFGGNVGGAVVLVVIQVMLWWLLNT